MTAAIIETLQALRMRLPFDHWADPPLFAGRPRTTLDSVLVRVQLRNGLVGWGEAYGGELESTIAMLENRVKPLVLGREATDANLVAGLERTLHNVGRSGPLLHALSGLDIALWDLRGKLEGVPLYELLGGARRTRIPAYGSLLQYYGKEDDIRRNVQRTLDAGFRHIKLHERTVGAVAATRSIAGPAMPLMVDANCAWQLPDALEVVREMAAFDLTWIEEPLWPPEDHAALLRLKAACPVPVAVGENATSRGEFASLQQAGAADFLQPCAIKSGGLTLLQQVSRACTGTPVRFSPQAAFFGPGFLATLHAIAAHPEEVVVERIHCDLAFTPYASTVPLECGAFTLTDGPGLGADLEEALLFGGCIERGSP